MPRIYTEIRIPHKTDGEKLAYECELDRAIKNLGYTSRAEWLRQMAREAIHKSHAINANIKVEVKKHNYKIGDTFKNTCTNEIYKVISVDDNAIIGQNNKEKRAFGEHLTYGFEDLVEVEKGEGK